MPPDDRRGTDTTARSVHAMTASPTSTAPGADWERRNADLWAALDGMPEEDFRAAMDTLVGELPDGDGTALFERAAAWDSTGHSDRAVPLYAAALDAAVPGERRRRAVIQMASSLRNLGRSEESVALLTAEAARTSDHLDDAVTVVLALALTDLGRAREAVSLTVTALAPHLPRYQRSMANYGRLLLERDARSE
ncbi:Tetratrico peptide repeat-containing protein [Actinacidiphila bryophytorum]|uniref:Tetratrico peptide repeat-containing protein n=1 Tax=Actinacidiphila bryophytorum TaxID=1436133 RepID=A0A9W4E820_9ACTN|nr:Tetratrico peptide repeat-containing protein [Actinacidiphila bryophytorum]